MAEGLGSAELRISVDDSALRAGLQRAEQQAVQSGQKIQAALSGAANLRGGGQTLSGLGIKLSSLQSELQTVQIGSQRFRQLQAEIASTQAAIGRATGAVSGFGAAFRSIAGIAATVGIGVLAQQIAATGQESQRSEIQLKAVAGAYGETEQASAAAARAQQLLNISSLESRQNFAQFYSTLRGAGIGVKELEVLFVGVSKAARLSGAGAQEVNAALVQLRQGLSSGRLAGDELRSVLEQLPVFAQALARTLNVNVGDLRALGSEGKITSEVIINAAKELATAAIPPRTAAEQIGVAFTNLKEEAAKALGPALTSTLASLTAAIQAFGNYLRENRESIIAFGKGVLQTVQTLAPFVAGILAVRTALAAWSLAAKSAAVAQAALLALQGPKGWAILAAGLGASAGAAVLLDKALKGAGDASKKSLDAAKKAAAEFNKILSGAGSQTGSGSSMLQNQGEQAASEAQAAARITVEASNLRLDAARRIVGLEGEALQIAQAGLVVEQARAEERRALRDYEATFRASNGNANDPAVIQAAAAYKAAGDNVKVALIQGAQTAQQSLDRATQNLQSALIGGFDILTNAEQGRILREAADELRAAAREVPIDLNKVNFGDPRALLSARDQARQILEAARQTQQAYAEAGRVGVGNRQSELAALLKLQEVQRASNGQDTPQYRQALEAYNRAREANQRSQDQLSQGATGIQQAVEQGGTALVTASQTAANNIRAAYSDASGGNLGGGAAPVPVAQTTNLETVITNQISVLQSNNQNLATVATALNALAGKDWGVNVNVQANGSAQVSGDAVNRGLLV